VDCPRLARNPEFLIAGNLDERLGLFLETGYAAEKIDNLSAIVSDIALSGTISALTVNNSRRFASGGAHPRDKAGRHQSRIW
jgi:hypothetical protein